MDLSKWFNGILFVGDMGMLLADYGKRVLLPKDKFADFKHPSHGLPSQLVIIEDTRSKTGAPTLCNFEYSGSLIEHNCSDQWLIAW